MRLLPLLSLAVALWTATAAAAPPGYKPKGGTTVPVGPEPVLERPGDLPLSQVLLEAGWAKPYGDLGDDFVTAPLGFGAGDGMDIGFCWRVYLSQVLSLGPAFHYCSLGSFTTTVDPVGDVDIKSSVYAWTVELMLRTGASDALLRPFLAMGGGLYRNRVVGTTKDFLTPFDQSVNTLGWSARAGFAVGELEFSAVYNLNRFTSLRYFDPATEHDYNWDILELRVGWAIPLGIPLAPGG